MSLSIGIVGLPNVGKSTLFNALVKANQAEASNYPFCTIDPNVGVVEVPDQRLDKLTEISKSEKTIPTAIEFTDIAGLVKNAHKGEGLGNKFLSHIKEADAIAMVVRCFENEKITHVEGEIDPSRDIQTINLELILSDLDIISKRFDAIQSQAKSGGKEEIAKLAVVKKIKEILEQEKPTRELDLSLEEKELIHDIQLITTKPVIYIANVSEEDAATTPEKIIEQYNLASIIGGAQLIPISAKIEAELAELDEAGQKEFLESLSLEESGLNRLIKAAYKTLGLITFLTTGPKETRAWTVRNDAKAPEAASVIHTDFERGFIKANVISYDEFIAAGSETAAREKGKIRSEGKDYVIKDGDIVEFAFNV